MRLASPEMTLAWEPNANGRCYPRENSVGFPRPEGGCEGPGVLDYAATDRQGNTNLRDYR
ncbi:hypothetical protein WN48_00384 [Eufriesea mexicana]|uniref:Uncharacterized protein n=1 Tax=Eufriesea mexicana TaxID=516756 RepID=A0A310S8M4_9HYME|nr:hypothetical protein WN48_00384 [Eufriesea mexicana]